MNGWTGTGPVLPGKRKGNTFAPCQDITSNCSSDRTADDRFSGNGGLSLRRVSAIRKILSFQARYNDTNPEDEWFGERLYITPGLKVASGLDGALAVENVYKEKPMGYHVRGMGEELAPEVWGNYEQRKKILEYCPELYTVLNAKLDRERCPGDTKDGGK